MPVAEIKPTGREGHSEGCVPIQLQEDGIRGERRDRTKGTSLPTGLHPPHAEVQRQVCVSGDLKNVVWGQPDLGLGIKEGKEIETGWSDAWNREERTSGVSICGHDPTGAPRRLSPFTSLP